MNLLLFSHNLLPYNVLCNPESGRCPKLEKDHLAELHYTYIIYMYSALQY